MVGDNGNANTYEEARQKRLEENKKRFEELGILEISKSLSKLSSPEKKHKPRPLRLRAAVAEGVEPRRSSRARTTATTYQDEFPVDISPMRKKRRVSKSSSSWTSYIAKPVVEVKFASHEDRMRALKAAEKFQARLLSGNPSFVKSMVRSHVYSCFWLALPTKFCKTHLPEEDLDVILEDENGSTCDAKYLGSRAGLSGGWRGFALDHKLDDGDALVFELVEPNKFKVYTFKVSIKKASRGRIKSKPCSTKKQNPKKAKASKASNNETSEPLDKSGSEIHTDVVEDDGSSKSKNASRDQIKSPSRSTKKRDSNRAKASKGLNIETPKPQGNSASEMISSQEHLVQKNNGVVEENDVKDDSAVNKEVESVEKNEKQKRQVGRPRKKSAPKLFRR